MSDKERKPNDETGANAGEDSGSGASQSTDNAPVEGEQKPSGAETSDEG